MRVSWLLILLALVFPGQDKSETYGKTNAQIRAMGFERWSDFYADKAGHTTMAMNDSAILFAAALYDGNQRQLARLPKRDQTRIRSRLKILESISDVLMDARSRQGGSMWITLRAQQQVYNEQFATKLIKAASQPSGKARADLQNWRAW